MGRLLIKYLKPYRGMTAAAIGLLLLQAVCELSLPNLMSNIVDLGIRDGRGTAFILATGGQMLIVALCGGTAAVFVGMFSAKASAAMSRDLRRDLFAYINHFTATEFDHFSVASLITRCTNDITQIQTAVTLGMRLVCFSPIMAIGGVVMAIRKSPEMSWIIALAVLVLLCIIGTLIVIVMPKFKRIQELIDQINLVAREALSGVMVIRAFGTQQHEIARFEEAAGNAARNFRFINRVAMSSMTSIMTLIMNGTALVIVWVGAREIQASTLQVGDMMAFIQYSMVIIMSFIMLSMLLFFIPQAMVSADRILQIMDTPISITDPENPAAFDPSKSGVVEFDHVSFRYPGADEYALRDVSFTAEPGKTTAIIGSTGSGKTTAMSLLLRFCDVTEGSVRVSGADVRTVTRHALREKIGYVPQKAALLSGTVASNLRYGRPDADDEALLLAAEIASAAHFIAEREDGLESEVAQGGVNLSGGQRQRLSIARALAKNPEILVFDDSFSALDFKTDAAVRAALARHTADACVIVIAQRVNTILNADQILVFEQGRLVGRGTHSELLRSCPEYREIASSQLGTVGCSEEGLA